MQAGTIVGNLASAIGITTEDAALVADLKAGSEEAFRHPHSAVHQPLYFADRRSLNDPADAADITQEVFIKVFRSIRSFHGDSTLRTWLYRIALREASNQRRWWSRHKKQEITIDSPYESSADDESHVLCLSATLADHSDSPFDHAAQTEIRERIEAALRQLPEAFRTVVILREIEGFAYEEIAEILASTWAPSNPASPAAARLCALCSTRILSLPPSAIGISLRAFHRGGWAMTSQACASINHHSPPTWMVPLPGRQMQRIAEHLEACSECAGEFAALRNMQRSLAALGPAQGSRGPWSQTQARHIARAGPEEIQLARQP